MNIDFSEYGYEVKRELGRNPEGGRITYLAIAVNRDQPVVLKEYRFAVSGGTWSGFKAYQKEIQALQQLQHPRILCYLDCFETPQGFCLVQEYSNAPSLAQKRSFIPEEIKQIALSVLEILIDLQNRMPPIIHRQIKPENILVDPQLNAYLMDFGTASTGKANLSLSSSASNAFTPPEENSNRPLTLSSDLYSLGVTLIALITGISSEEINTLIDTNNQTNFKHLTPQLNPRFSRWLEKMVAPNPKHRFANAAAALKALHPIDIRKKVTFFDAVWSVTTKTPALPVAAITMIAGFSGFYWLENFHFNDVKKLVSTRECVGCNLENYSFAGADLKGVKLQEANLKGANLAGANLEGANLSKANLEAANLKDAKLTSALLPDANLQKANLQNANLAGANLEGVNLGNANLIGTSFERSNEAMAVTNLTSANLAGANLTEANLSGVALLDAYLKGANLENANLKNSNLENANLKDANLKGANLKGAKLRGVNLHGVNLEKAQLLGTSLQSARLQDAKLKDALLIDAKLDGAKLDGADLQGVSLYSVNLQNVNFQGVSLVGVELNSTTQLQDKWQLVWRIVNEGGEGADLKGVDLTGANLSGANLKDANLEGANLEGAYLQDANLKGAKLKGAKLKNAHLPDTSLAEVNLNQALLAADINHEEMPVRETRQSNSP